MKKSKSQKKLGRNKKENEGKNHGVWNKECEKERD